MVDEISPEQQAKYDAAFKVTHDPEYYNKVYRASIPRTQITKVKDADTVSGEDNLGSRDFRFLTIDAYEADQGQVGKDSTAFVERLMGGKKVIMNTMGDSYGRKMAHPFLEDGTDVLYETVKAGYGRPYRKYWDTIDPAYAAKIDAAEAYARENKLGYHGYYEDGSNSQTPEQWRLKKRIDEYDRTGGKSRDPFKPMGSEVPTSKDGAIASTFGALDYLNNAVRVGMKAGIDAPEGRTTRYIYEHMKQALANERYASATDVRDAYNLERGVGKVRFGTDNDDEWTFGDAIDTTFNIAFDIGTDPLTYIGLGIIGRLAKAPGQAYRAYKGVSATEAAVKASPAIAQLAPAGGVLRQRLMAAPLSTTKGLLGGAMGWGATSPDDPLHVKIGLVAAGVAAGTGVGKAVAGAGFTKATGHQNLKESFEAGTEWYLEKTGRGLADKVEHVAKTPLHEGGATYHKIWKEFEDGSLAQKASKLADEMVPVIKGQDVSVRAKAVSAQTAKLIKDSVAPVETFLRGEAELIVDSTYKIGAGVEEVARREELVQDTVKQITELRLGATPVARARRLEQESRIIEDEYTRFIASGRYKSLEGLTDAEKEMANNFMREQKGEFVNYREKLYSKSGYKPEFVESGAVANRVKGGMLEPRELPNLVARSNAEHSKWLEGVLKQDADAGMSVLELNRKRAGMQGKQEQKMARWSNGQIAATEHGQVMAIMNQHYADMKWNIDQSSKVFVEQNIEKGALKTLNDNTRKAVESWKEHNLDIVKKYNDEVLKVEVGAKGLHGIPWHTSDVFSKELMEGADTLLRAQTQARLKMARFGGTGAHKAIGEDAAYLVYAKEMAGQFLNDTQKQARKVMTGVRRSVAHQPGLRTTEKVLEGFDTMTNFAKANMLYFSLSWLKNNYWDNLAKAYVEGGLQNAGGVSTMGLFNKNVRKDIWALSKGEYNKAFNLPDVEQAVKLGVMEGPAFNALIDRKSFEFMNKENPALDAWKKNKADTDPSMLKDVSDGWVDFLSKYTGRWGSYMESSARFITWKNLRDDLLKRKDYKGLNADAEAAAAAIVKKTFFDYGDVTMMESAVFKRLIPFYSFYSKNLPYWAGALVDHKRTYKLAGVQAVRDSMGDSLTDKDRLETSPYLLANYARKVGKDSKGNDMMVISPSFSFDDAINWVFDPFQSIKEKTQPVFRSAYEAVTGDDLFSGGKILPSTIAEDFAQEKGLDFDPEKAKKFLYSRGFKWYAIKKAAEALGLPEDTIGMTVDKKGNPYAFSDGFVIADKALQTFFPQGLPDQLAGAIGKSVYDKETFVQTIFNLLAPLRQLKVSRQQKAYQRFLNKKKIDALKGESDGL